MRANSRCCAATRASWMLQIDVKKSVSETTTTVE
jgi:hypothetical protein